MQHTTFYKIKAKLAYRRSPIMIRPLIDDFYGYDRLNKNSELIIHNNFKIISGKKWFDLVPFSDSFHFAISDKVKMILEENNITGWNSFPIKIIDNPDRNYHVFYVNSIAGEILKRAALNNYETEIYEFGLSTWNGSYFFSLKDTLLNLSTEKVMKLFRKHKISNISIEEFQVKTNE